MASPPECPICGKERVARYRPFCSARCAEIDLGHWFTGRYAIPAEEPPEGFDDEPPPPPGPAANDDDEFL